MILLLTLATAIAGVAEEKLSTNAEMKLARDLQRQFKHFPQELDRAAEKSSQGYALSRVDVGLGMSVTAGLKIFSVEKEKSIELVWQRELAKSTEDTTLAAPVTGEPTETLRYVLPRVLEVLAEARATNRVRRSVIRALERDARKLNRYVRAVSTFNQLGTQWQVESYFKNYYFSAGGDLLVTGLRYDKRLRFRFYVPTVLSPARSRTRYERRIHRRLQSMARHLADVSARDDLTHRFVLNRVRSVELYDLSLDLGFAEISKGRGILLEWKPLGPVMPQEKHFPYHPSVLRRLATTLEQNIPDGDTFKLSQIRLQGSLTKELSLLILSYQRTRDIEYHYRRRL